MKQVGSEEARRTFRDLLDDAQQGESAEITRNGKPIAILVPVGWHKDAEAALARTGEAVEAAEDALHAHYQEMEGGEQR